MVDEFPLISTRQYKEAAMEWLKALDRQESVSVVFIPKTDRTIRLGQLLTDHDLIKKVLHQETSYIFQRIDFDQHDVEDIEDLSFQISEQLNLAKVTPFTLSFNQWIKYLKKNSMVLVLIVTEAEKFLNPTGKIVLSLLSKLIEDYSPTIRMLSFFETNITHPSLLPLLSTSTRIYENISHFPLYAQEDTLSFIRLLRNQWNVFIDKKTEEHIIESCGGHFWLVKEAVREISVTGKWSGESEGMLFRLRVIFNLLLQSEQSVIRKIINRQSNFTHEENLSLQYLKNMGVVDDKNRLLIGIIKTLLTYHEELTAGLSFKNNQIFVNEVPVNKFFSRKEYRVMKVLLEHRDSIVTRDDIAKAIWPINTQDQYSDWAIDQLILRIRKRMVELSLPPKRLKVVRGKGYRLALTEDSA